MKENRYDDPVFFDAYTHMARSQYGLKAAGEWETLQPFLTDIDGKTIVDLGCGYGWHEDYFVNQHASHILAIDISTKMLNEAKTHHSHANVTYQCMAMEDVVLPENSVDLVFSSLALHYVKDYDGLVQSIVKWLKPNGRFIFSIEHPVFTAKGDQQWIDDENGNHLYFPVDHYYKTGKRDALFVGCHVIKYHRPLDELISPLLDNGFTITALKEPRPPVSMMDIPGMKDEMRRPMMLIISTTKTH